MKLNLLLNSDNIRSGYINVDPISPPAPNKVHGDVGNLDWVVDDAECEEIVALDVFNFMPANLVNEIVDNWITKLRHGGIISIGGVDIRDVAKALVAQKISVQEANILLYGEQTAPWQYRKSTLTLQHMIDVLQNRGLQIIRKDTRNYYYFITAKRS